MSYSSQTKEELCRFEPESVCCRLAELSGIVSAAGSVILRGGGERRLSIETENIAVARRAFRLLQDVFEIQPELVTLRRARLGGRSTYRVEIVGGDASFVLEGCGIGVLQRRGVPREVTVRRCCRISSHPPSRRVQRATLPADIRAPRPHRRLRKGSSCFSVFPYLRGQTRRDIRAVR